MVKILLDAGHGGKDGGASKNGIHEKDIVLKICKKIQAKLNNYLDVKVLMSRETDTTLSMEERTNKANNLKADILVSVHTNSATTTTAKGFESYRYITSDAGTIALQNVMHQEIIRAIGGKIVDRGKKSANFHMLRESHMKAILTENLFISNVAESNLLKDDSFLDKIAQGHVNGLVKFLGLKLKERQPIQPTPTPTPAPPKKPINEKLYIVQVGAFEHKENAEKLAEDLRKQGYRPLIKYQ